MGFFFFDLYIKNISLLNSKVKNKITIDSANVVILKLDILLNRDFVKLNPCSVSMNTEINNRQNNKSAVTPNIFMIDHPPPFSFCLYQRVILPVGHMHKLNA